MTVILPLVFAGVVAIIAIIFIILYAISGFGQCQIGQAQYFKGTRNETCAPIGTKIDPLPLNIRALDVTISPWTGWSEAQPEDVTHTIILDGAVQTIDISQPDYSDEYTLTVLSFDDNQIQLSVSNLALKQGEDLKNAGSNLNDCVPHTFTMKLNEKVELDTCTLDGGITWELEYI